MLMTSACQVSAGADREADRQAVQPVVSARIALDDSRTSVNEPVTLRFEVKNDGSDNARLLIWNTPLETVPSADMFEVVRQGRALVYRGRMVKRSLPPGPEATMVLRPGAKARRELDLAALYELGAPGSYTVRLRPLQPLSVANGSVATAAPLARIEAGEQVLEFERY